MSKVYLGDSVYADYKYGQIILTTNNGVGASNIIYLEPEVYHALTRYVDSLRDQQRDHPERETS